MKRILFFLALASVLTTSCVTTQTGCGYSYGRHDPEAYTPIYNSVLYVTDDYTDTIADPVYEVCRNGALYLTTDSGFMEMFTWGSNDTLYNGSQRRFLYIPGPEDVRIVSLEDPSYVSTEAYILKCQ